MSMPKTQTLLLVVAVLLAANLVVGLQARRSPEPVRLLPAARAEGAAPMAADLRTGETLVTASPDGSVLYVWYCRIVNGFPTFEGHRYRPGMEAPRPKERPPRPREGDEDR